MGRKRMNSPLIDSWVCRRSDHPINTNQVDLSCLAMHEQCVEPGHDSSLTKRLISKDGVNTADERGSLEGQRIGTHLDNLFVIQQDPLQRITRHITSSGCGSGWADRILATTAATAITINCYCCFPPPVRCRSSIRTRRRRAREVDWKVRFHLTHSAMKW